MYSKCNIKLDLIRGEGAVGVARNILSSGVSSTHKVGATLGQGRDKYREREEKAQNVCKKQLLRRISTGARRFTQFCRVYISCPLPCILAHEKGKTTLGPKFWGHCPVWSIVQTAQGY